MPHDEDLDEDDELDEEEGDEEDDDDDEEEPFGRDTILDDLAEVIPDGLDYAVEVDIVENRVVLTLSDESRWELTLTKVG
jgi:hypothetical protein